MSAVAATPQPRRDGRPTGAELAAFAVGLMTVAAFVLRLTQMDQSLFGDEVFTYQDISGRGLGAVIRTVHTGAENSPPLFFMLAWLSAKLGDPTVWIRLPSLLLGTATIPLVYLLGLETVGRTAGVIAAAALALSPFSVYYGIEARPYATMLFFLTLSTLALLLAVRSGSRWWWALYAVSAAGAAYSHYTAVFVLAVQALWSLWACRDRLGAALSANVVIVALYVPWLGHLRGKSLLVIGLLEPLNAHNVLADVMRPLAGYPYASLRNIPTGPGLAVIAVAAVGGAVALAVRFARGRHLPPRFGLMLAVALATPIGLLLYSMLRTDLWLARNLYASVSAAALILGALLAALPRRVAAAACLAVAVTLLIGTVRAISPSFARPQFRVAAAQIDRDARDGDVVVVFRSFVDSNLTDVLHKRVLVVRPTSPAAWRSVAPGRETFAIVDDRIAADPGVVRGLRPPGFTIVARRHYGGMDPFSVLTYRRT